MYRFIKVLRVTVGSKARLRPGASRHDLVLAAIPAAFAVAWIIGYAFSVPETTTVTAASVLSGLAVADALFRNPPRDPSGGHRPA